MNSVRDSLSMECVVRKKKLNIYFSHYFFFIFMSMKFRNNKILDIYVLYVSLIYVSHLSNL